MKMNDYEKFVARNRDKLAVLHVAFWLVAGLVFWRLFKVAGVI